MARLCAACLVRPDRPASILDLQLCARAPDLRFLDAKVANLGCFYQEAQNPDLRFLDDFSRNGCASWQKHGKYYRFCPPVLGRSGKAVALLGIFRAFIAKMVALLGKSSALFVVSVARLAVGMRGNEDEAKLGRKKNGNQNDSSPSSTALRTVAPKSACRYGKAA